MKFHAEAIVGATGIAIGLFAALLYMAGWTYAYWYFSNYQLGLSSLDFSRDVFFIYGVWVAMDYWPWLLLIGAGELCPLLLASHPAVHSCPTPLLVWCGIFFLLSTFILGHVGARGTAASHFAEDQATGYLAARRVEIIADQNWLEKKNTQELANHLASGCYRLLIKTQQDVFLIRPVKGMESTSQPLLAIPTSEINAVRILTDSDSCP